MPRGKHLAGIDACNIDMHVYTIEHGAADATLVRADHALRTRAGALLVAEITARTRVRRSHQHEPRRKPHAAVCTRHHHLARFHGLANALQHRWRELGQLVKEQHAVMRKRYGARPRRRPAAHKPRQTSAVVGRAKRAHAGQLSGDVLARYRMNDGRLKRFCTRKRRQNRWQARSQHGFT